MLATDTLRRLHLDAGPSGGIELLLVTDADDRAGPAELWRAWLPA